MSLLNQDDLAGLLAELDTANSAIPDQDPEMEASQKRYMDIIKKHKNVSDETPAES